MKWTDSVVLDVEERSRMLRAAAERSATDAVLIDQLAANDPRPIEAEVIEREIERAKTANGCRSAFDEAALRTLHLADFL